MCALALTPPPLRRQDESPDDLRFVHGLASVDLVCSLLVVVLWVKKSYAKAVASWVLATEMFCASFFLLNYCLRLLRAGLAPRAAASGRGFVDLLTAVPLALQGGPYGSWLSLSFLRALCCLWAYEALEASGALEAVSDTLRRAVVIALRFAALVVVFAGALYVLETLGDVGGMVDVVLEAQMGEISFYQMCYFIFVTISTVGYGDFTPRTVLGRAFVGVVIAGGVVFFSVETSAMLQLFQSEASGRGAYRPRRRRHHIVVTGGAVAAGGHALTEFLDELVGGGGDGGGSGGGGRPPPRRGRFGSLPFRVGLPPLDVVLLCVGEPAPSLRELLRSSPPLRRSTHLVVGSPLEAGDRGRAAATTATRCFVLAAAPGGDDGGGDGCEEEDGDATLAAIALAASVPCPVTLLVNASSSLKTAHGAGLDPLRCFAADSLTPASHALSALAPGGATLVANLTRRVPPAPARAHRRPWHDEYLLGLSAGLHAAPVPPRAHSTPWAVAASHAYDAHGVVLLAHAKPGRSPALCPAERVGAASSQPLVLEAGDFVWAIADHSSALAGALHELGPPRAEGDDPGAEAEARAEAADWRARFHAAMRAAAGAASATGERADPAARGAEEAADADAGAASDAHAESLELPPAPPLPPPPPLLLPPPDSLPPSRRASSLAALPPPPPPPDGFSDAAAVNAVAQAGGHTLVLSPSGDGWHRLCALFAPLLPPSPSLPSHQLLSFPHSPPRVVLLSPTPPPHWVSSRFPSLLSCCGSPSQAASLLRAGADTAACVLHAAGCSPPSQPLRDRRAVLGASVVERLGLDCDAAPRLVLELACPASIKYLPEAVPNAPSAACPPLPPVPGAAPPPAEPPPPQQPLPPPPPLPPRPLLLPRRALAGGLDLADLAALRTLLSKGLLTGQGALNALLGTELALLSASDAPPAPPLRASPALHLRYASGRAVFASDAFRSVAADAACPGAASLVAAMLGLPRAARRDKDGDGDVSPVLRLVPAASLVAARHGASAAAAVAAESGATCGVVFASLRADGATPLALFRSAPPDEAAEAAPRPGAPPAGGGAGLPYVFACPPAYVAIAPNDGVYVLASPAWHAARNDSA